MTDPAPSSGPYARPRDERLSMGLVYDVTKVLEQHGYKLADPATLGAFVGVLAELVEVYEGRRAMRP